MRRSGLKASRGSAECGITTKQSCMHAEAGTATPRERRHRETLSARVVVPSTARSPRRTAWTPWPPRLPYRRGLLVIMPPCIMPPATVPPHTVLARLPCPLRARPPHGATVFNTVSMYAEKSTTEDDGLCNDSLFIFLKRSTIVGS